MKTNQYYLVASIITLLMAPNLAPADEGNWKTGRIYYRMVCTSCHIEQAGGSISPASKTIAEWKSYLNADNHAKGKDKVSYYVSKDYRESIKDTNRAAAKFIKVPNEVLMADVKAFVIHGGKDSKTPARCN